MFICGLCGKVSKPNEAAVMVVMEIREVVYPQREYDEVVDKGGTGCETVREVLAHKECADGQA